MSMQTAKPLRPDEIEWLACQMRILKRQDMSQELLERLLATALVGARAIEAGFAPAAEPAGQNVPRYGIR